MSVYATPPRCFASRASNFLGFIYDPTVGSSHFNIFFRNSPVQLSATLCQQLRTIVDNVMRSLIVRSYVTQGQCVATGYNACQYLTLQIREILIGSIKYHGIYGYFCYNIVYPKFWHTRTGKLSCLQEGHVLLIREGSVSWAIFHSFWCLGRNLIHKSKLFFTHINYDYY